ncbi:DUF3311 domain-containing protein [Streptomyces sp. NPDC020681]|uniref:DUF3311 domain-containing protein n=1 Tax=Streptomyces sp. NPDC020681 TaxID=3365083 RepID=UPI0037A8580D
MSDVTDEKAGAPPAAGPPPAITPVRIVVALCLFTPFVAMLWVGSYAKVEPQVFGIPFFYWYQMLWVLISTVLTMIAYKLWQRDQRARKSQGGGASA